MIIISAIASLITWLEIVIGAILFIPIQTVLFLLTAPFDKKRRILHYNSSILCLILLAVIPIWRLKINGKEYLDRKKAFVITANHQSLIDILLVFRLFYPVKMIAKKSLAIVPVIGWNLFFSGHLLIDRNNRKSQFDAIRKIEDILGNGESFLIFPEGTRTRDGNIGEFKKGAFRSAVNTGTPILPVIIDGAFQSLPPNKFIANGFKTITINILPPIEVTSDMKMSDVSENCRNKMVQELDRMRG